MSLENMDLEPGLETPPPPPEESGNRAFWIVIGVLAAIALLVLICISVYAFVIVPGQKNVYNAQRTQAAAQNTKVALAITQTSSVQQQQVALAATKSSGATQTAVKLAAAPTFTPVPPTATKVVNIASSTSPPAPTDDLTATVSALRTEVANKGKTQMVTPSATQLGKTGFAEDIGLPTMIGLALLLMVVIFLARRLRTAN